ncbi:MAG: chromosome partitioning protein ParB, partial [Pseudomonas sp.]|nr:chromosome partitioning protein ParB [Pseudomonas sp.]
KDQAQPLSEPDYAVEAKDKTFNFADEARTKMIAYEYWGFRDLDGSGEVQPFVATWVGDVLIRMEKNPFPDEKLPFVAIPYLPVYESVYGESDGSLLIENQKTVGAVQRGIIDVFAKSANGQVGMAKGALDAPNLRKFNEGRNYEFNPGNDPRSAIHMHTFQEIPVSAWQMLESQNRQAEAITGVQAFSAGLNGASLGDTATGVRGALDAASKRELGILRRLASGMVKAGRKLIAMNAVFLEDKEVIRVTNDAFVDIRRDDLAGNFDLSLGISTAEEDNAKAQELSFMLQTVGPNAGWEVTAIILADIARLRKMPDLAKRIEDYQPQPDPIAQQKAMLELKLLEAQIASEMAKAAQYGTNAALHQVKQGTEVAKANALNANADKTNLDFIEQETGVKQERDKELMDKQHQGQAGLQAVQSAIRQQEASQMNKPGAL